MNMTSLVHPSRMTETPIFKLHSQRFPAIWRSAALMLIASTSAWLLALYGIVQAQTPQKLDDGAVGRAYEYQLQAVSGTGRLYWEISGGNLPPGIGIDSSSGRLSGTPAKGGEYTFEVRVTDDSPVRQVAIKTFRIDVTGLAIARPTPAPRTIFNPSDGRMRSIPASPPPPSGPASDDGAGSDAVTISVANEFYPNDVIDPATGAIKPQKATNLIESLIGRKDPLRKDDYCIVHIVKWKKGDGEGTTFESNDRWYLFQKSCAGVDPVCRWDERTEQEGARIYGSRRVAALLIHLQALPTWDIRYNVKVTGKLPMPVQNLQELAGILSLRSNKGEEPGPLDLWGGQMLPNISRVPSNIELKGDAMFANAKGEQTQQPREFSKIYDNEGRYHWDVSVGFPFTKIRELEYSFTPAGAANNGFVTTRSKERQNAYAFLNLFFNPNGVDLKQNGFLSTPHLVVGLPFAGKPLDRPVVGLGMGVYKSWLKVNFFAGAVFNNVRQPRTLNEGDPTTNSALEADFHNRRVTKLIFGVNFPLSQAREFFNK
jgi:hypothetical protein